MGREIERKFLVNNDSYRTLSESSERIRQGYLSRNPERTVRVRIKGDCGYLTVKGKNAGIERAEFEYNIPVEDAEELLQLCEPGIIDKTRYKYTIAGHTWEIDEFHNIYPEIVVAEIELSDVDDVIELPEFIGTEVTGDPRYYNSNMITANTDISTANTDTES